MNEEEIIEIFDNLKEYIQDKINRGEHKIYYNDLMWDVKCVDCISAMDNILDLYQQEKEKNKELKEMLERRIKYTNELEKDLFENGSNQVISKNKIKELLHSYSVTDERFMQYLQELLEEE